MRLLPLYKEAPRTAVQREQPMDLNHSCLRCPLSAPVGGSRPRTVCMAADGEPGGLLVVGKAPGREEDSHGRPNVGATGRYLRGIVQRLWNGPIAYDNGVRCFAGGEVEHSWIDECRGYLAGTLAEVKPTRALVLGGEAAYAVFGRSVPPLSSRRGVGWLAGDPPVPAFLLMHPAAALRNRFMRQQFEADIAWALTGTPQMFPPWQSDAHVVENEDDTVQAIEALRACGRMSVDVETAGRMFDPRFTVLSVAICSEGSDQAFVWDARALSDPRVRGLLSALLSDPTVPKSGQNAKYDAASLRVGLGIELRGLEFDTRLARKLIDPEAAADLGTMSELVGMGGYKEEVADMLAAATRNVRRALDNAEPMQDHFELLDPATRSYIALSGNAKPFIYAALPRDELLRYNARDAVSTARLSKMLSVELEAEHELHRTWTSVVLPAALAIERVEHWGILVSREAIGAFQAHLNTHLSAARARFDSTLSPQFNPNSSVQVSDLLFRTLRLPPLKTTDSGKFSTDVESLESLRGRHPVVDDLLKWRRMTKLKGTYADGMAEHVRADDRVHPSFHLDGARSGRLSCSEPNLQNIPRAKDSLEGKMARDVFIAPAGRVLLETDYSQIELRVAAMLSGDPLMRDIFIRGEDYHLRTAQMVAKQAWGIEPSQVEDKHRSAAKTINFGLLYGQGDEGLAAQVGCPVDQAARIREAIFGSFKMLASWIRAQTQEAQRTGYVWTWWNGHRARRRPLFKIADQDGAARSRAEHGSFNSAIQGTASDFCTASLSAVVRWIDEDCVPAKLVLAVHDSLIVEVDKDEVDYVADKVREIMLGWPTQNGVPMEVDMKVGVAWGSLEKYKNGSRAQVR